MRSTSPSGVHTRATPVELGRGLYVIPLLYELDGRAGSYPLDSRGVASTNVYLFVEDGHRVLLETGFSIHERALIAALDGLGGAEDVLTIWTQRIGEYAAVCNVRPLVERFVVDAVCGSFEGAARWADFRPEYVPFGSPVGEGTLADVESRVVRSDDVVRVGTRGREVVSVPAPLRLLPVNWAYDALTRTLFTADAFGYVWHDTAAGPWVLESDDDHIGRDEIWRVLTHSRFWWLSGADTTLLRRGLAETFQRFDVETIAPAFGAVLRGREVVRRHVSMLDDLLAEAPNRPSLGLDASRWRLEPRSHEGGA